MQVTIEDISPIKKRLRVELPGNEAAARIEAAYRDLAKTAKVKGFRPNKVPRGILERMYKDHVQQQVATELMETAYPEAISQAKIDPVGQPLIENYDLKPGEDFKFSALVEVKPQIELEGYDGLEVTKPKIEVTDDMVDMQLEMMREEQAVMEDAEGESLAPGLWANADFQALHNGQPVKALTSMGELFRVGEGAEQSELEKGVVGMRQGEVRDITVHLPANYQLPSLRDQDVTFKVSVHAVKRKVLPPLDEELAKELKFESVAAVREQCRKELTAKADATAKRDLREGMVTKLIGLSKFDVPESMVEREIDSMVASLQQRLRPRRVDVEDLNLEKIRENFRKQAERRARAELILDHIAAKEDIQVSDEDVEHGIQELALDMKEEPERVRHFHEEAGLMGSLRKHLREEKTLEFLTSRAKVTAVAKAEEAAEK